MNKHPVLIISGPTATNKTGTSLALADHLEKNLCKRCVIVNFDSLLFYKELSIGTAKPNQEELLGHPHELININSISSPLNAADYENLAKRIILKHQQNNKIIILVGGSSFYIRALIKGMYNSPTPSLKIKQRIDQLFDEHGINYFINYLSIHDPESMASLHPNDHYRIIRSCEHHMATNQKFSSQKKISEQNSPYDFSINQHPSWKIFHLYLDIPKEKHQKIIENRVDRMINDGLIDEVRTLLSSGHTGNEKPLNSVGYKEVQEFLIGNFKSVDDMKERIVISTRQLAKAQRTFFNKVTPKNSYNGLTDIEIIKQDVIEFINNIQINSDK